jgi:aryl-phospho-beta-D-glucosidase BglC (GH1 family)
MLSSLPLSGTGLLTTPKLRTSCWTSQSRVSLQDTALTDPRLNSHYYSVFSDAEVSRTWGQHLNAACSYGDTLATAPNWAVVGEWSELCPQTCNAKH